MKPKDKSQSEKFVKKAKELECNDDPEVFERAFKKIVPPKNITKEPSS